MVLKPVADFAGLQTPTGGLRWSLLRLPLRNSDVGGSRTPYEVLADRERGEGPKAAIGTGNLSMTEGIHHFCGEVEVVLGAQWFIGQVRGIGPLGWVGQGGLDLRTVAPVIE